jgi:Coatomer WD associated region
VEGDTIVFEQGKHYTVRTKGVQTFRGTGIPLLAGEKIFSLEGGEVVVRSLKGDEEKRAGSGIERLFKGEEKVYGARKKLFFELSFPGEEEKRSILAPEAPKEFYPGEEFSVLLTEKWIVIVDEALRQVASVEEVAPINNGMIEGSTFFYSTLMHVKFCFRSGESGVLISTEEPSWFLGKTEDALCLLHKDGEMDVSEVDFAEWRFKNALEEGNREVVRECIESEKLLGQASLSYLVKRGFYDEALSYIDDPGMRFDLALREGKMDEALKNCRAAGDDSLFKRLGKEALSVGDAAVAEECFSVVGDYTSLILLYIARKRVDKLEDLFFHCPDNSLKTLVAIIIGNNEYLIRSIEGARESPMTQGDVAQRMSFGEPSVSTCTNLDEKESVHTLSSERELRCEGEKKDSLGEAGKERGEEGNREGDRKDNRGGPDVHG